eukprot:9781493-Ditylum_brightwellii.AAC.1
MAIAHVLLEQPDENEICSTLLRYFKEAMNGHGVSRYDKSKLASKSSRKKKKQKSSIINRLFIARAAAPIFTELINALLSSKPDDVVPHIVSSLEGMILDAKSAVQSYPTQDFQTTAGLSSSSKQQIQRPKSDSSHCS